MKHLMSIVLRFVSLLVVTAFGATCAASQRPLMEIVTGSKLHGEPG
jgi:hypothetical protein